MAILDNIRNVMNKVIRIICIVLFAFMVIIGTYQILVRYIFKGDFFYGFIAKNRNCTYAFFQKGFII